MAGLIGPLFAAILIIFKFSSSVPMSTTWVFIGLLAGAGIGLGGLGAWISVRTYLH